MKFRTLALAASAAVLAAQAHAITIPAGTPTLYVSGSSALTPVIKGIFAVNAVAGTTKTYTNSAADQILITATVKKSSTLGIKLGLTADTLVALFKRDAGGSAYGVNPLATNTPVAFLNEASVSVEGANASATTKNVVPQLGAADVEPALLQQSDNLVAGFSPLSSAQLGTLATQTALLQTFGIAVNNNLYTALQAAQGTSGVPSINTGFIRSLVNVGGLNVVDKTWGFLLGNDDASQINICRRAPGSGTQAGANILFSQGENALRATDSDAAAVGNSAFVYVNEAGSTGGVKTCLNGADAAGSDVYAIGYVGYENKPGSSDSWKFVNLDGVSADIGNAKIAKYQYAFENTFNYNKSLSGVPLKFVQGILAEASNPAVIATLTPALQSSVIPVAASNATRGGNSKAALKIVK